MKYLIQPRVSQNHGHCINESHLHSEHPISEIKDTTEDYSMSSFCFKVYIIDAVSLMYKYLNWVIYVVISWPLPFTG